ncbi:GNAT family N-acetyltransferase [Marinobacter sp. NP-4(2019)]|uniref:GNAT family N-acetyltransferase n=1 Tax=Marinobacter sp. NP-4(2019) TaxID=2488665 RepID=UPI000FC3F2CF|nr:GNAT family N-acetyltransferase [Marinobacter sp. NP-4(2019)]AZT82359.1 GNAT family N-acetyltransferase [Marinobacter sp. NP-4(2019)]
MKVHRLTSGEESLWSRAVSVVVAEEDREGPLVSQREIAQALGDSRCYLVVAEADGDPVGLLSAYRFPDVVTGGELIYLYDIEVRFDHRRKGVGTTLIHSLIECGQEDRVRLIWAGTDVMNVAARRAFEATGAKLEGESYAEFEWRL